MRILALETSTEHCSCAILVDEAVTERVRHAGQSHSSILLPMVEALMGEAGFGFGALDAIAFGAGPGSFTGLRIAVSVAQGLAFAHGLPVVPVTTLEALAEADGAARVLACLDARMGELYLAAYQRGAHGRVMLLGPTLANPAVLPELAGSWRGVGSGFARQADALARRYHLSSTEAGAFPRAQAVARLGRDAFASGTAIAAEAASPLYLRNKVALDVHEQAAARAARSAKVAL